jgi:hypothetical protein
VCAKRCEVEIFSNRRVAGVDGVPLDRMTDAEPVLRRAAGATGRVAPPPIEAERQTAGRRGGATGRIDGVDPFVFHQIVSV